MEQDMTCLDNVDIWTAMLENYQKYFGKHFRWSSKNLRVGKEIGERKAILKNIIWSSLLRQ